MRGSGGSVTGFGIVLRLSGAFAADLDLTEAKDVPYTLTVPTWSVVGSISPTFTSNALFSRDDRRPDVFYEPDVSVRLDGNLSPDLSYRLYARAQFESFANAARRQCRDRSPGSATNGKSRRLENYRHLRKQV